MPFLQGLTYNPVNGIWKNVFRDNKNITKVIIPDSVTNIENAAFANCTSFTNVTIPDIKETTRFTYKLILSGFPAWNTYKLKLIMIISIC